MPAQPRGEYPPNWKEISRQVKEEAGWRCIRCGHVDDHKAGYMLTVHHLDGDKANVAWWNLTAPCQRCHLRIQGKVVLERVWMFEHTPWFKPYVAGYHAHLAGRPTDRAYVLQHLDELQRPPARGLSTPTACR